jgi:uncharacterized DUF497 family protein
MADKGGDKRSSKVVHLDVDRPLTNGRAMQRIKALWTDGKFTWLPHAEQRLIERGLDITDVEVLVRYGKVVESSRPGAVWRYKVEGSTAEGKKGAVVFELAGDLLILVSVMLQRK